MLICRYIKFIHSIKKSTKFGVQFRYQKVKNNVNTVTGKNIAFVLNATGYDDIEEVDVNTVKKKVKLCEFSEENRWKVDCIKEIVNVKYKVLVLNNEEENALDDDELNEILEFISTS